jgi:hypothetical protein
MKKQNQASTKNRRTTKKRAQQEPPLPSPTAIRLRDVGPLIPRSNPFVKTGELRWDIGEFETAERNCRFVAVEVTEAQMLQLRPHGFELEASCGSRQIHS